MSEQHGPDASEEHNGTDFFVEGLLESLFQKPLERERRIDRVLKAIGEPRKTSTRESVSTLTRSWKRVVHRVGAIVATAAVIAFMFLIIPREVEAGAQARAVFAAERQTRDRRVLFQLMPPRDRNNGQPLVGMLDIRDSRHLVLMLQQPNGFIEIRGRDSDHFWKIGPGPELIDLPSDMPWPTWIQSPGGGLLVDMAEALEQGLGDGWKWSRVEGDSGAATPGMHLVAVREQEKPGEPNKIDLRINPATGLATKIEMEWPDNQERRGSDGRPGGEMRGDRPPPPEGDMEDDRHPPPPEGDMRDGDRPPPPPEGGMRDGDRPPPPARGGMDRDRPQHQDPKQTVPMGPPSKLILMVEPPITFDAAWFTPEKQMAIYGKESHGK
ncbi:MAG: hypothetical protein K8R92_07135 [Planctomycetes bacterium]|nr:hypothetical protein [Planctomycetota bacterium]